MKKKLLILSLSVLLLVTGCGKVPKLENGKEVVASIDGLKITADDLFNELKKQYGTGVLVNLVDEFIADKEVKTDDVAKKYAQSQLDSLKLQYQQSGEDFNTALANAGYKNESEFVAVLIKDYKKNKVTENYVSSVLTEKEINEYYEKEIFGEITARHILITPDVTSSTSDADKVKKEEEAKKKALDLIKKLQDGAKFEDLAKEHSDDKGTATEGGLISNFKKSDVVLEFWNASFELEKGKYTVTPVKSQFGYHIILKVSQNEKPKLKDVEDTIKESLVSKKLADDDKLSSKAWSEVRKKYKLDISDDTLKNIYKSTIDGLK